jgi:hypothetical protein
MLLKEKNAGPVSEIISSYEKPGKKRFSLIKSSVTNILR